MTKKKNKTENKSHKKIQQIKQKNSRRSENNPTKSSKKNHPAKRNTPQRNNNNSNNNSNNNNSSNHAKNVQSQQVSSSNSQLSELQQKFQKKLEGARFRTINERLYTCRGDVAFNEFQQNSNLFHLYHEGYREQVKSWPQNPLDIIINWIKSKHRNAVIADMGCGEARLAASLSNHTTHSFDLVAANSNVIACDIAHVPLEDESVDIVVFCLSLMGTNVLDFLREASRILRLNGILKIAEVRSRFEGETTNTMQSFLQTLKKLGFQIVNRDMNNTMFFMLEAVKKNQQSSQTSLPSRPHSQQQQQQQQQQHIEELVIQPCLYKRR